MIKESMLKMLESLGLKNLDAEVYLYLLQLGPQKVRDISKALEEYEWQLYRSLKSLQRKGMVNVNQGRPAQFSAISLDKVLDQFIQGNREEAARIEENKEKIFRIWRSGFQRT